MFGGHWAAQAAGLLSILPLADPRLQGIVLGLGAALVYPGFRGAVGWFVDTWVVRREPHARLVADLGVLLADAESPDAALTLTCSRLEDALQAGAVAWAPNPHGSDEPGTTGLVTNRAGAPVETVPPDTWSRR